MLELRGAAPGLLDDPLLLEVGGAAPDTALVWRARLRDDDGFVWRAAAPRVDELSTAWVPAKATAGPVAALRSLRPVDVDVRVEAPDGSAASRTLTRRLLDDGVRVRRWRDAVTGTLYLPAAPTGATAILDAAGGAGAGADPDAALPLAAALLASRGVRVLVVAGGRGADPLAAAREQLAAVPGADAGATTVLAAADVPLPAGVGLRGEDRAGAIARAAAWDDLLRRLGARPRATAR
jgi:hypothetical protein